MQAIFDFLLSVWEKLLPWAVVEPNEAGVRIRSVPFISWLAPRFRIPPGGQWVAEVAPGAVFKLPLFDTIKKCVVKRRNIDLSNITVELRGGATYIISLTLRYAVKNVRRALLETEDFDASLVTDVTSIVARWATHQEGMEPDRMLSECYEPVRVAGFRWGCEVEQLALNTVAKHRIYRIVQDQ